MSNDRLLVSSIIPISEANGPGPHFTIWCQGCNLKCPGCYNPHTHNPTEGYSVNLSIIIEEIKKHWKAKNIRGVTLTGGEPLNQINVVLKLIKRIKSFGNIGIIILTGYEEEEVNKMCGYSALQMYTDVIIAGRFRADQKLQDGIRGSENKKYLWFSDFYSSNEFNSIPPVEASIKDDGTIIISGINPEIILDKII